MPLHVASLHVHPVKSARGHSVQAAALDARGLALDRGWMIVDERGAFLTQRAHPRLALVDTTIEPDALRLDAPDLPPLRAPLRRALLADTSPSLRRRVRVWDDTCDAVSAGDEAAAWLSRFLGRPAELVHLPDDAPRPVDPRYASAGDQVGFADGFPLLIVSRASLDEFERRLAAAADRPPHVPAVLRFRPNLVIEGCPPHAEDAWRRIAIGDIELSLVKPCARCVMINVDPSTGAAPPQALRVLASYRTFPASAGSTGSRVLFGQNALHRGRGTLAVGARVTVLG